jgi:serine-type D-Ala-D-Ala carboxypeptidase/endopeptidase (penicillin-binding protein 4)
LLRRLSIILFTLCLPLTAWAVDTHGRGPDTELVKQIDTLLEEPGLKGGFQGVIIQSLADGKTWYERNSDLLFLPASNQKLLTSSAILNALGPDWAYTTSLYRVGSLDDDGTLHGNLYLKGSGDPLLEAKDLDDFVASVKTSGVKKVQGKLITDDTRLDSARYGDGWSSDDMSYYYSAQISALNLNENLLTLTFDPGRKPGDAVRVAVSPTEKYARVVVRARTVAKGEKTALTVKRALGENVITVDGTLALDAKPEEYKPVGVTVEDPTRYVAYVLLEKLRKAGIDVTGGDADGAAPTSGALPVAQHVSPPLSEILKKLNKPSDNLVAECLLKTLGAEKGKTGVGSAVTGRDVAYEWFKSIGMDTAGIDMTDGSGLSRQNFVTPRNLALLLKTMYTHPHGKVFIESLPVAGVDGTLRNRMKGTAAEKNCKAKSGYVSSVSSLSGYVTTKAGEPLLFVMLMNNHKARNAVAMGVQNKIVEMLAERMATVASR